ncbi:MAG: hypothetical protein GX330_00610 [Bacteroidales bacterium]|nr:hypothetical protein [Bacteroidales bacterium]
MKRVLFATAAIVCLIILTVACSNGKDAFKDYKKTETGLYYKFEIENKKEQQVQIGDLLVAEMKVTLDDSLLFDNFGDPQRLMMVVESDFKGDLAEGLRMLHLGDVAYFAIAADSIAKIGVQMPPFYKSEAGQRIVYYIKLHSIVTEEELMQEKEQQEKELMVLESSEQDSIDTYLAKNNIKQKPTESGLYYIETLKGTGQNVEIGKTVTMNYTGKFLNGEIFDSSLGEGREPMEFVLQEDLMIKGFTEGLLKMKDKGKATLIIPSKLAYGKSSPQSPIPPYATIIFDVEILNVQ